jgi:hypothetical protein
VEAEPGDAIVGGDELGELDADVAARGWPRDPAEKVRHHAVTVGRLLLHSEDPHLPCVQASHNDQLETTKKHVSSNDDISTFATRQIKTNQAAFNDIFIYNTILICWSCNLFNLINLNESNCSFVLYQFFQILPRIC